MSRKKRKPEPAHERKCRKSAYYELLNTVKNLHKQLGHIGTRIGTAAEKRAVKAFAGCAALPKWFCNIRAATGAEDAHGADVIVVAKLTNERDAERVLIPIQIKTSHGGKEKFVKERGTDIPVVIVWLHNSDKEIRNKILTAARSVRTRLRRKEVSFPFLQQPH